MSDWEDDEQVLRREQTPRSGGLRHDVAIPAHIEQVAGENIRAEIVDVSSTGMYLRIDMFLDQGDVETLASDSSVTVVFVPDPANAPKASIKMVGQVARRDPHGIGIHFEGLDREQMRALRTVALRAVESRSLLGQGAADADGPKGAKVDSRLVSSMCLKVLERRLANVVWTLRTELVAQLRGAGATGKDDGAGSARADADLITDKGTAISRTAERRVIQSFAQIAGLDATQQMVLAHLKRKSSAAAGKAKEEIGLVGDKAVESRVILDDTCQRMETVLAGKSFGVNVRLANVLRRRIDEDRNNPLIPEIMCRMLWQAVTSYCDTPRVHGCLRAILVQDITPLLSELYDQIDETLDAHGVPDSYWMSKDGADGSRK